MVLSCLTSYAHSNLPPLTLSPSQPQVDLSDSTETPTEKVTAIESTPETALEPAVSPSFEPAVTTVEHDQSSTLLQAPPEPSPDATTMDLKRKRYPKNIFSGLDDGSDLSDYPDDLSDCSEAIADKRDRTQRTSAVADLGTPSHKKAKVRQIAQDKKLARALLTPRKSTRALKTNGNQAQANVTEASIAELTSPTIPRVKRLPRPAGDSPSVPSRAAKNRTATKSRTRKANTNRTQTTRVVKPQKGRRSSKVLPLKLSSPAPESIGDNPQPSSDLDSERALENASEDTPAPTTNSQAVQAHNLHVQSANDHVSLGSPITNFQCKTTPARASTRTFPPTPDDTPGRGALDDPSNDVHASSQRLRSPTHHPHLHKPMYQQSVFEQSQLPLHEPQQQLGTRAGEVSLKQASPNAWPSDERDHSTLRAYASKLILPKSPAAPKPAPSSEPEVWADGRQELCETLHYFRAYHSGGYATGGFARGFMFDKSAHARDFMDSTVVIARAGGGMGKDKVTGERVLTSDRTEDSKIMSLRSSMQYLNPVVIITGADNPNCPVKPPHTYSVLDYFKPTHIWAEKSNGKVIFRYRFEKLDATKPSWWEPHNSKPEDRIEHGSLDPPVVHSCHKCHRESQQVYLQGWMCLQPTCPNFWLLGPTVTNAKLHEPVEAELEYDPCFLKQQVRWPNERHKYSLTSNDAELSGHSIVGEDCSLAYWLGMVCPKCGKCNSRLSWTGWECANTSGGCTWKKEPLHTFIPALSLRDPFFPLTVGYTLSRDSHLPIVKLDIYFKDNYRINRYTIPGINGFVAHLIANKTVVEEESGPDQMFEGLQREDIGLRRRSLGTGMLKGEGYTRHFTVNYGMPYKFIAATASESFEGSARPITHTRTRLNWAAKSVLAEEAMRALKLHNTATVVTTDEGEFEQSVRQKVHVDWKEKEFNEVLALGYFEQQRINYHDDGEFGLGPTIATLSLGAPGTMRLRMKGRHHNGVSSSGVYDDSPPLPGCASYEARVAAQSNLAELKQSSPAAYRARLKTLPKELKLKSGGNARDAIVLTLAHGDIVIMHGAEIQKYYEHSVDHAGKLRFALTCRYIDPDSLKEADRPDYEVKPDDGDYDGSRLPSAA